MDNDEVMMIHFSLLCQSIKLYGKTKIYQHLLNENSGYDVLLVRNTTFIFNLAL
jgi:uncharacterized protein YjaG (DUF416 family)